MKATEQELDKIVAATVRSSGQLQGEKNIGLRVGKVLHRFKMAKHIVLEITDESFNYHRNQQSIAAESLLDGIYVIRTSVEQTTLTAEATVLTYKSLSVVERAFRSFKLVDLQVRPIYHRLAERVRGHILLCMLAYYVEWHMRAALAPILFDDQEQANATAERLKAGRIALGEWEPLSRAVGELSELNIFIDDRANPSIFDIRAALRLVASNHGQLGMVLVDYLQLMGSDSNSSFRVQELDKESVITSISAIDRVQFTPFVTS